MKKKNLADYRKGAAGALIDEYERAAFELKEIVQSIDESDYSRLADAETKNEDCRSIQTIASHIVRSGYGYANYIRENFSMNVAEIEEKQIAQAEIGDEIEKMLAYTAEIFEERWEELSEDLTNRFIVTRRRGNYSIEQMLQHAIVHVLRHRRQVDKFLLKFQEFAA